MYSALDTFESLHERTARIKYWKNIYHIIVHCKIFFKTICVIWLKVFRNIDSVSLFKVYKIIKYEFDDK